MTLTSVELFTGAGGLALGLHQAGFRHEALIEVDRSSCDTLRANVRHLGVEPDVIFEEDVARHEFDRYRGRVDIVAGGVPCQPFSLGGKHRGHADERNLFPQLFRAVREIQPKVVVVENVRGLARPSFRPYYDYIKRELELPCAPRRDGEHWQDHDARLATQRAALMRTSEVSYDVHRHVIDCADYGVPQRRRRIFFLAFRADLGVRWQLPEPTHTEHALLYSQWVDGSYWKEHGLDRPRTVPLGLREAVAEMDANWFTPAGERWCTVRDALRELPAPLNGRDHRHYPNHVGNPGARAYPGHTGSPWDQPAKTLKAGDHGVPGGENMLRNGNGTVRYFTAREAACLQTFPLNYLFCGAWTECLRQIGNAVPVAVARLLGEHIALALEAVGSETSMAATAG